MNYRKALVFITSLFLILSFVVNCRTRNSAVVTLALDSEFTSLDFLAGKTVPASAERIRSLIFNTLVKKDEKFDYVGELASDIKDLDGGSTISFTLRDGVKFHNGNPLKASDVKYTFEKLTASDGAKAASFFETVNEQKKPHILAIETPDDKTVNFKISRPTLKNQLLSNMVAIPIIAEGTFDTQKNTPMGTGAYKFVKADMVQKTVDLEAFNDYWEGAPKIQKLQVRVVADSNAVQSSLKSGQIDVAPTMINLSSDTIDDLGKDPNLKVGKFDSANVQLLTINVSAAPLDNVKVRQAIAYGIDRDEIINQMLRGQGKIAHSILPQESWAYSEGTTYSHDIAKAKQLLDEAGVKDPDGDGPQMRLSQPIKLSISAGNGSQSQYSQVIQNQLKQIGIPIDIVPVEFAALTEQWRLGQFQITMNRWVGGNQDPIFYRDLFLSTESTDVKPTARNRSRYKNKDFDAVIEQAVNEMDREKAKKLYAQAQAIISRDLPIIPLWYPSNMVVYNKRLGGMQINASADWFFVRNLTLN
jgi:peptide/nickel transport system substrate-binding protein